MQFEQTKTYSNLARAFAGESQAGMRYQLIAQMASTQGYDALSNVIKAIAKNETVHAKRFIEELRKRTQVLDDVLIDASYPFHGKELCESLLLAAGDEHSEHTNIYPLFAKDAKEEGFEDVARLFNMVAKVEERHEEIFKYLHKAFKDGTLYKCDEEVVYICSDCGFEATLKEAWNICPLCNASQGYVELRLPPRN